MPALATEGTLKAPVAFVVLDDTSTSTPSSKDPFALVSSWNATVTPAMPDSPGSTAPSLSRSRMTDPVTAAELKMRKTAPALVCAEVVARMYLMRFVASAVAWPPPVSVSRTES